MLPFLEIPMCIANNEKEEKGVVTRIQPNEIAYYYPGFHWGTVVVMKSGSSFLTVFTSDELDAALKGYDQHVKAYAGKFGNLQVTPKSPTKLIKA